MRLCSYIRKRRLCTTRHQLHSNIYIYTHTRKCLCDETHLFYFLLLVCLLHLGQMGVTSWLFFVTTTVLPPRRGSLPCRQRYIPSKSGCGLKGRRGAIKDHMGICGENELHCSSDIIGVAVRRQCQLAHWGKEP